jgi:ADP-ribose pyrophosphatase
MSEPKCGREGDVQTPRLGPRRLIYHGRKFDFALQPVQIDEGSVSEREIILHPGAVVMIPMLDPETVCLIRVHRWAAGERLWEVPAGTLDPGETPEQTALRELREETGYTPGKLTRLAEWWVSPGIFTERMHLYLCEELTPGSQDLMPDEWIEPHPVPWSQAMDMVARGEIQDAKTMIALLWYDRMRG